MGRGSARENAELSIPDFAGEPYFLGNFQKCFFFMRALFPFIFPEILRKGNLRTRSTAESFSRGWLRVRLRVKRYAVDERFALRSFLLRCSFFLLGIAYATICVGQRNARKVVFRLVDLQNTLQRICVALLRCAKQRST